MELKETFKLIAKDLIARHGETVKVQITGERVYDPATGAMVGDEVIEQDVDAVVVEAGVTDREAYSLPLGTKKILVATESFDAIPNTNQAVVVDGVTLPITSIDKIRYKGTSIIHKLFVSS